MTDHIRQINAAILAHDEWKAHLLAAIEAGSSTFEPNQVRADDLCAFGKWLQSAGVDLKSSPHYERVCDLHVRFHKAAADVLTLAIGGMGTQALTSLEFGSDYVKASVLLVDQLELWRAELERG
jgi:methyl-accepting chemotaxis protein